MGRPKEEKEMKTTTEEKKKQQVEPIILHELFAHVELDGVKIRHIKYPCKYTGKNFVDIPYPEEKYPYPEYHALRHRVKSEDLLKVEESTLFDSTKRIWRKIYFLEKDIDEAKKLLKTHLDYKLSEMKQQVDILVKNWENRHKK